MCVQNTAQLVDELENLPELEDKYFPTKYDLPVDYYTYVIMAKLLGR